MDNIQDILEQAKAIPSSAETPQEEVDIGSILEQARAIPSSTAVVEPEEDIAAILEQARNIKPSTPPSLEIEDFRASQGLSASDPTKLSPIGKPIQSPPSRETDTPQVSEGTGTQPVSAEGALSKEEFKTEIPLLEEPALDTGGKTLTPDEALTMQTRHVLTPPPPPLKYEHPVAHFLFEATLGFISRLHTGVLSVVNEIQKGVAPDVVEKNLKDANPDMKKKIGPLVAFGKAMIGYGGASYRDIMKTAGVKFVEDLSDEDIAKPWYSLPMLSKIGLEYAHAVGEYGSDPLIIFAASHGLVETARYTKSIKAMDAGKKTIFDSLVSRGVSPQRAAVQADNLMNGTISLKMNPKVATIEMKLVENAGKTTMSPIEKGLISRMRKAPGKFPKAKDITRFADDVADHIRTQPAPAKAIAGFESPVPSTVLQTIAPVAPPPTTTPLPVSTVEQGIASVTEGMARFNKPTQTTAAFNQESIPPKTQPLEATQPQTLPKTIEENVALAEETGGSIPKIPTSEIPIDLRSPAPISADTRIEDLAEPSRGKDIPDLSLPQKFAAKVMGTVSTEAPFRAVGAPTTGKNIKVLASRYTAADEKAIAFVKKANKLIKNQADDAEVFFSTTNPTRLDAMTPEKRARIKPAVDMFRELDDRYGKELQDLGVLKDLWPQSAITRLRGENATLAEQTQNAETISKMAQNKGDIERLGSLKHLHLPARVWMEGKAETDPDGFRQILSGSFSGIKGRKTIDPIDLVRSGVLDIDKVSAREAMGHYIRYVEGQRAQALIRDSAIAEGVVKDAKNAPAGWVDIDPRFPIFRGKKIHPMFAEIFVNNFTMSRGSSGFDRTLGVTKMLQFWNAFIMPMYDMSQGLAVTQGQNIAPSSIRKGWKSVLSKDTDYWQASDNGLFSQPFRNPFSEFKAEMDRQLAGGGLMNQIKHEAKRLGENPARILGDIYTASWNSAWYMDKVLRMQSYHALRKRGMTPDRAARLAAEAHADYAGVPAETRKGLNRILFTPTFQISMLKWFAKMVASTARAPFSTAAKFAGKPLGEKAGDDLHRMATLAATAGILGAGHYIITKQLGWETEQWGRKYFKVLKDPDTGEEKEAVVTFSNPLNVPMKYYHNFIAPKPGITRTEQASKYGRYMLHPLWKLSIDLAQNSRPDGSPIANPFSSPAKQFLDVNRYVAGNIFAMYRGLIDEPEDTKGEALRALKEAKTGPIDQMMRPIAFYYLRKGESAQVKGRINDLSSKFAKQLRTRPPKTAKELQTMYDNHIKLLDGMESEVEKGESRLRLIQAKSKAQRGGAIANHIFRQAGQIGEQELDILNELVRKSGKPAQEGNDK